MRYLVFSDVHGNLPALEAILTKEADVSGYINLGDVVNYGPWSNECVELIDTLENCVNILGNHEEYFNSGNCNVDNQLVRAFFESTFPSFTKGDLIKQYKASVKLSNLLLVHTIGEKEYIFRDTDVQLISNTLLGHSHQQYIRYVNGRFLANPGSVGQNRKFIDVANYIIWDIETGEFQMKSLVFNLDYLLAEMKRQSFPNECLAYYNSKKRFY